MNEFLNQFLLECREFIEQGLTGLQTLEGAPANAEVLDAVFRAFHTLKGGAGIVEFAAMEKAVHAAENVLSAARSGRQPLSAARIADCISCLDQVSRWLDIIEHTGELPVGSDVAAENVIRRFASATDDLPAAAPHSNASEAPWLPELLLRHPVLGARARSAVRYIPSPDCFYQGSDPVALATTLPGLLSLDLGLAQPPVPLGELDPYLCNLVIHGLSAAPAADVSAHLNGAPGSCEVRAVESVGTDRLSARAREVLEWQVGLLVGARTRWSGGTVVSAGQTAANLLRAQGQPQVAERLMQATQQCHADDSAEPLLQAIAQARVELADAPETSVPSPVRAETAVRTLRVDADRIDTLARLVSELIVTKNAVGHLARLARSQANALARPLQDNHGVLERLVGELQASVLGLRVIPLQTVLQRFPRVVRELSASLGKSVQLVVEGEDTQADKTVVEMLFEPLLHIVRNAIDHGIEAPATRLDKGKPQKATLRIAALREGDQVRLEVSDDGKGVDVERVREVARHRGIVPDERLQVMTDEEIVELIFAPGFSTASNITELSGRGVGMDAVRSAVERLGGRVVIESHAGLGTTIRILLPFSVMMTRVMTVAAGDQTFGIPVDNIIETVRVPRGSITQLGAAQAMVVRDRTIPVVDLADALNVSQVLAKGSEATVVITSAAGQMTGIRVDRLGEQLEVILQPLEGLLSGTPGITGTTLMGDGRVLLVLDIGALLQ